MKNQQEAITWAYQQVGKPEPLTWGGWSQCVAFARNFVAFLGCKQPPGVAAAKDLWRADWGPDFIKVGTPRPGDIGILGTTATNPSGHINVIARIEAGRIITVDQNLVHPILQGSQGSPPAQVSWAWPNARFLGFIRPIYKVIGGKGAEEVAMSKPSAEEVKSAFKQYEVGVPTGEQITYYTQRAWDGLLNDILNDVWKRYKSGLTPATPRQLAAEQMLDTIETALNFR